MTARGIGIFTIDFPDPTKINYVNNKFNTLNESISFQYRGVTNIQTLSTKGVDSGADPYGILYVPDLLSESCRNDEVHYVPANATRITNLPPDNNYALIAFAPWFSAQCMLEYFAAAREHSNTKGFLTYLIGNDNAQPPVLNNPAWDLQDGGMWQQLNTFPTYALSSTSGSTVIDQLNLYSGNLSTVPNGDDLGQIFDSTDYIRLWATISTDASSGTLPSLWVFLVIVLAILIAAIGTTSLAMHIIQRRRRNALRRRVLNGTVDLEALGVKRLTVSQQVLDKMPIVTYTAGPNVEKAPEPLAPGGLEDAGPKPALSSPTTTAPPPSTNQSFTQPTCPICIDDFEHNVTQVRELPCRHIFHPDCIDTFLLRNSSLCPMCKQSTLPPGACPVKITNMMVRRERHISRMRARSEWSAANGGAEMPVSVTAAEHARGAFGSLGRAVAGRRIFSHSSQNRQTAQSQSQSQTQTQTQADIEMGATAPATTPAAPPTTQTQQQPSTLPAPPAPALTPSSSPHAQDCEVPLQPPNPHNRREWARQRALAMLGPRHAHAAGTETEGDVLEQEERATPGWKKVVRRVFPGFR